MLGLYTDSGLPSQMNFHVEPESRPWNAYFRTFQLTMPQDDIYSQKARAEVEHMRLLL
uniref:Uncharacterized protein n=1 Tax=Arion vulgaris TaxID=1028688 RepID=A0A0B7BZ38_9EUPU